MNSKKCVIIIAVVAIVVGAVAFFDGMVYEKSSLSKQGLLRNSNGGPGGNQQARQGGRAFGGGQGGNGGPNGANGSFVTGDIISKDDKSITVKTRDGGSKIVFFSDSTAIGKSVSGSASDLASGEQVMASGKTNADGTLTADNIQIRPSQ
jgi:hypothetical protein